MRAYLILLREKLYLGAAIVICCAAIGSFRGAADEYAHEMGFVGITQEDIQTVQRGDAAPEMTGLCALAAEQNQWKNFSYAAAYGRRGILLYLVMMACYLPLYRLRDKKQKI